MTAEQKKSPRKSKSFLDQEKFTAELSSGQLVLGVVVLLIFGLACFMLGIVVGKVEPTDPPKFAQRFVAPSQGEQSGSDSGDSSAPTVDSDGTPLGAPPESAANGPTSNATRDTQTDERDSELGAAPNGIASHHSDTGNSPAERDEGPNHVLLPAPPAPDSLDEGKAEPSIRPQPIIPELLAVIEPPVFDDSGSAEPVEPVDEAAQGLSAGIGDNTSTPQEKLPFSVQVIALRDRERAAREQAKIEARSDYSARLEISLNGRLVHVLVGAFATKSEAERAKEDIRKNLDYTDAYVRKID